MYTYFFICLFDENRQNDIVLATNSNFAKLQLWQIVAHG